MCSGLVVMYTRQQTIVHVRSPVAVWRFLSLGLPACHNYQCNKEDINREVGHLIHSVCFLCNVRV